MKRGIPAEQRSGHSIFLFSLFAALASPAAAQTTWYVDDDNCPGPGSGSSNDPFCRIQDAIQAAFNGDTVLVLAGTYFEQVDFLGKEISLKGRDGAEVTIIDSGGLSPAVRMETAPGLQPLVEGFTITGVEYPNPGPGLYCNGSGTVRGNILKGNSDGGLSAGGATLIEGNLITGNGSNWGTGGMSCSGQVVVRRNRIVNNGSGFGNGGLSCWGSAVIKENVIAFNGLYDGMAAGISCGDSVTISGNLIYANDTNGEGIVGGILCNSGTPVIVANIIMWNVDGGIECWGTSAPFIANNMIAENYGTGIMCDNAAPTIVNTTIVGNTTGYGGLACVEQSSVLVTNTIFWENEGYWAPEIWVGDSGSCSTLTISFSDIMGGQSSVAVSEGCTLNWGPGMIDQDPRFVAAEIQKTNNVHSFFPDYHLGRFSPCINRGTNAGAPATDIDGEGRPTMGSADMGADEFVRVHLLEASPFELSAGLGGSVNLYLNTGTPWGGRPYLVLGSVSGTAPGIPLPGGLCVLPLQWDIFTGLVIKFANTPPFTGFRSTLDPGGSGMARFDSLGPMPPETVGLTFGFAFALTGAWDLASNPIGVIIGP
ncbi:MAG: right-handed parallel beta-helix repeat-containing protein [Planctomycetota bacterium]